MKTKVARWGNSLALRLPKQLTTSYQLSEGSDVEIVEEAQGLLVKPFSRRQFQLEDLLKGVSKNNLHTEIESEGMNIGLELARLFMEQSVGEQAGHVPEEALECEGEVAKAGNHTKSATLETAAGEVEWEQPRTRLANSRRDFFPSGEGIGGQH